MTDEINFYSQVTTTGLAAQAQATANGEKAPKIVKMVFGAGTRVPNGTETELEDKRLELDIVASGQLPDQNNTAWFETVLPPDVGGFNIGEAGLVDEDGNLVVVAHYSPAIPKPVVAQGGAGNLKWRITAVWSSLDHLTLNLEVPNEFSQLPFHSTDQFKLGEAGRIPQAKDILDLIGEREQAIREAFPEPTALPNDLAKTSDLADLNEAIRQDFPEIPAAPDLSDYRTHEQILAEFQRICGAQSFGAYSSSNNGRWERISKWNFDANGFTQMNATLLIGIRSAEHTYKITISAENGSDGKPGTLRMKMSAYHFFHGDTFRAVVDRSNNTVSLYHSRTSGHFSIRQIAPLSMWCEGGRAEYDNTVVSVGTSIPQGDEVIQIDENSEIWDEDIARYGPAITTLADSDILAIRQADGKHSTINGKNLADALSGAPGLDAIGSVGVFGVTTPIHAIGVLVDGATLNIGRIGLSGPILPSAGVTGMWRSASISFTQIAGGQQGAVAFVKVSN